VHRRTRYRLCKNVVTIQALLSDMNDTDVCANKANLCQQAANSDYDMHYIAFFCIVVML
jgi:hypothetical protein